MPVSVDRKSVVCGRGRASSRRHNLPAGEAGLFTGDTAKSVEESAERQFLEQKRVQIHLREEVRNDPKAKGTAVER